MMKSRLVLATISLVGCAWLFPLPAQAGLIGTGRTVQAFYYNGVFESPEAEIPVGFSTSDPASLAAPVSYQAGAADLSTINVGDTSIVVTNQASGVPYCLANTPLTACTDTIDGFEFKFTGEDITGVAVNAASAPSMQPVFGSFQGHSHLGLQLISPNDIRIDLTGDLPALGDALILDLVFAPVPEAGSIELLLIGLFGLGVASKWSGAKRSKTAPVLATP